MEKTTKYWITFWSPGSFVANTYKRSCDGLPEPEAVKFPDNAYAFTIHKQDVITDGGKSYEAEAEQIGPTYYHPDSRIETVAEVRRNPKASGTLVRNMEINGWKSIVWTRWGNWAQPYEPRKMKVLPSTVVA